jgi:hypothetical protein
MLQLAEYCKQDGDFDSAYAYAIQAVNHADSLALQRLEEIWEAAGDPDAARRIRRFGLDDTGTPATSVKILKRPP